MVCKWLIVLALLVTVPAALSAQVEPQQEQHWPGDTIDLRLREGLEKYLEQDMVPRYIPEQKAWKEFPEDRHFMPYKNLRSNDPMPMMAIDDSTHYTLRIKRYPNHYKPDSSGPGRYRKFLPDMKP